MPVSIETLTSTVSINDGGGAEMSTAQMEHLVRLVLQKLKESKASEEMEKREMTIRDRMSDTGGFE